MVSPMIAHSEMSARRSHDCAFGQCFRCAFGTLLARAFETLAVATASVIILESGSCEEKNTKNRMSRVIFLCPALSQLPCSGSDSNSLPTLFKSVESFAPHQGETVQTRADPMTSKRCQTCLPRNVTAYNQHNNLFFCRHHREWLCSELEVFVWLCVPLATLSL